MLKLICGRSRAGKTTYSKRFDNVLHLDMYGKVPHSYPKMLERVKEETGNITIDGIYNTAELRKALLDAYKGSGARICIYLDTPLDVIESRFRGIWKPIDLPHPFETPTTKEGWDIVAIILNPGAVR